MKILAILGVKTPGGTPHMKGVGMLVGNLFKPLKETDLGVVQAFFSPLKETMLIHRQYTHTFYFFACNPKRDLHG